ncbi:hypothetical protein D1841_15105 [Neglecta sp. X4]|uniref:DNA ligase LigA-related protein n=1 Tax=unclassified Neglectibacter TaxID=2632164 RepID=UPI00136A219C|nr:MULTISPECIES: hypothetical protein [unclassified Neglectibacter]NBI18853.1 hypothetical protein [Neglectibacter sp. 59]NBJ74538.1 hypothetical protein [Neglectibacter sp. X4]NCE82206.1 hypothetical protein [Neglectibacter sp. X58]
MFVDEKAGRMKALIAKIRTADTAYYRDDDPIMTDREYDKLMDELQRMEAETGLVLSGSPTGTRSWISRIWRSSELSTMVARLPLCDQRQILEVVELLVKQAEAREEAEKPEANA